MNNDIEHRTMTVKTKTNIFCSWLGMPPVIYYLIKNYEYSIKGLLCVVCVRSCVLSCLSVSSPSLHWPPSAGCAVLPLCLCGMRGQHDKKVHAHVVVVVVCALLSMPDQGHPQDLKIVGILIGLYQTESFVNKGLSFE